MPIHECVDRSQSGTRHNGHAEAPWLRETVGFKCLHPQVMTGAFKDSTIQVKEKSRLSEFLLYKHKGIVTAVKVNEY